jgi:molybdopterin molybdotransferase
MQEDCREEAGAVTVPPGIKRGANRRFRGEDVKTGAIAIAAGERLRHLPVYRRLRVALVSTGDEVREPGTALPAGAIYDANRYILIALLEGLGCEVDDRGIVPDDASAVAMALKTAARSHDLVLSSGGMSMGEEDHVKAAVEACGKLHFWRLAIRPGRPVAMGHVDGVPFMGLPGNPVAVMVTFVLLARPLILRLAGASDIEPRLYRVAAGFSYHKKGSRAEYLRARLVPGPDGNWVARKHPRDGAGIISSLVQSDGLVAIGAGVTEVREGDAIEFMPYSEVLA